MQTRLAPNHHYEPWLHSLPSGCVVTRTCSVSFTRHVLSQALCFLLSSYCAPGVARLSRAYDTYIHLRQLNHAVYSAPILLVYPTSIRFGSSKPFACGYGYFSRYSQSAYGAKKPCRLSVFVVQLNYQQPNLAGQAGRPAGQRPCCIMLMIKQKYCLPFPCLKSRVVSKGRAQSDSFLSPLSSYTCKIVRVFLAYGQPDPIVYQYRQLANM